MIWPEVGARYARIFSRVGAAELGRSNLPNVQAWAMAALETGTGR
jgi:hypothetical protein